MKYKNIIIYMMLSVTLGGCSVAQNILPENLRFNQQKAQENSKKGGLVENDTEIIKNTVAKANINNSTQQLAWSNPQTGSSGTVVAINEFMGQDGQKCRSFKTSVATFVGIAFYDGDVCQISPSEWILSLFNRTDN